MAKLKLTPILAVRPPNIGGLIDRATSARYDAVMDSLHIVIGANEVYIDAMWAPNEHRWLTIEARVTKTCTSTSAARLNRLLTGIGAPRVETYHRTGSIVVRAPQHAYQLPALIDMSCDQTGRWVVNTHAALAMAHVASPAPVSPPAPVVTPAPSINVGLGPNPFVPTPVAQAFEALAQGTPEPEPEPVAEVIEAQSEHATVTVVDTVKVTPQNQRDPSGLMQFPLRSTTDRISMDAENTAVLEAYWRKHTGGDQSIVAIVGPSGTGKTSLIWDLAAEKQVGMFMFDAAGASSFSDWTGTTVLKQGEGSPVTDFVTSSFIEFARIDGPCAGQFRIGGVDELNRAETGGALNAVLPIWAQGQLFVPELGETIYFDPMVMWVATMNRGSAYNATLSLDAALADRMQAWVQLDNLTEAQETKLLIDRTGVGASDAASLVDLAKQVRDIADRGELTHSISTRRTLEAARAVKNGLTLKQAATYCWANSYLDEGGDKSDRGRVLTAIGAKLGTATNDETPW